MSEEIPNPYQAPTMVGDSPNAVLPGQQYALLDGQLATTGIGLKMTYWGILLLVLSWICVIPMGLIMTLFQSEALVESVFPWVYFGVSLLALGLLNLGPFLCLTVPRGYGLRTLIVATAVAIVLFWVAVLMMMTFTLPSRFIAFALLLLVFASFLAFLYRLSRVIGRDDLTRRCRTTSILGSIVFTFGLAASLLQNSVANTSGVWLVWPLVVGLGGLLLFVSYANVVNALANAIRRPGMRKPSLL